jgi:hypothetical protein
MFRITNNASDSAQSFRELGLSEETPGCARQFLALKWFF